LDGLRISATKRELGSKSYLHILRKSGKVPGVLHGSENSSLPLILGGIDLKKALSTSAGKNVLLNLEIEGIGSYTAMIENLQRDTLKEDIYLHVDLVSVSLNTKIDINIPIILVGQDKRVNDGGIVSHSVYEILIRSVTKSIPENIKVDISKMKIGDIILLKDIALPDGCEAITSLHEVLVSILHPRESSTTLEETETEAAIPEQQGVVDTPVK
jgi:large subunit ribosomal protein L25